MVYLGLGSSGSLAGSILPNQYLLTEAKPDTELVDQDFENWLTHYASVDKFDPNTAKISAEAFPDEMVRTLALLRTVKRTSSKDEISQVVAKIYDIVQLRRDEPMMPYIMAELGRLLQDDPLLSSIDHYWLSLKEPSCPARTYFHKKLTDRGTISPKDFPLDQYLERAEIHDWSFPKTLGYAFKILPKDIRNHRDSEVRKWAAKYPEIADDLSWFEGTAESGLAVDVRGDLRKKRCQTAARTLTSAISSQKHPFDELWPLISSTGRCYARRGRQRRLDFWQQTSEVLNDKVGPGAWGQAQLERARILWNADYNDKAREVARGIIRRLNDSKLTDPLSRDSSASAYYLLGRIADNVGDFERAVQYYNYFASEYPNHEELTEALIKLVLIHIRSLNWQAAQKTVQQIIIRQDSLGPGAYDAAKMGFALFWSGRAYIHTGQAQKALHQWHRLAKEFYSTYYGAMGHYMIEEVTGKKFMLQPEHNRKFDPALISDAFDGDRGVVVKRVLGLLEGGFKEEAQCELRYLQPAEDAPRQHLSKALMLHAAGRWLDSIKMYSNIPRGFRHYLPRGMERLLFPRRFELAVDKYASKVQVDPDLVFSLIRQESVFNPKARSSAGARGLMQLMRGTARDQARKLSPPYISKHQRKQIIRKAKSSRGLYDSDVNIALGVSYLQSLLDKYDDPVLSLSAYNAGPTTMSKWLKQYPTRDLLHFIELIPYQETRNYVKLILRNYFYYKKWYGEHHTEMEHLKYVMKSGGEESPPTSAPAGETLTPSL